MPKISDFRSDTVTRPTKAMREAMMNAEVGDDVLGDDPTVKELERAACEVFGKEASVFVPSGTMANQIGIAAQTSPGDEVILEKGAHIYNVEAGSIARLSLVQVNPIKGVRGAMPLAEIEECIRPKNIHFPVTRLIALENTGNTTGGSVLTMDYMRSVREIATRHGLRLHLDGARVFNAACALGVDVKEIAGIFDSMTSCLSKGLGAPIGSLFLADAQTVEKARKQRKSFGGGMRQVGVIAAPGLIALTEGPKNIPEDHRRAKKLVTEFAKLPGFPLKPEDVESNILVLKFGLPAERNNAFHAALMERGVWASNLWGQGMRFVTHRDVDDSDVDRAIQVMNEIYPLFRG
ncbi:MAG: beta-eliminating lyase-related protein [Planctomycetes bacterium]|nr:beta-eliminating lyase-related protein [Planctomycetota bacterium]